jgi:hypothetical protein
MFYTKEITIIYSWKCNLFNVQYWSENDLNVNWNALPYLLKIYSNINPLPALTYQNVPDLNVACQAKHTQTYWYVRTFKCPLKKTQPSCPGSRDLSWTSKGLINNSVNGVYILICNIIKRNANESLRWNFVFISCNMPKFSAPSGNGTKV